MSQTSTIKAANPDLYEDRVATAIEDEENHQSQTIEQIERILAAAQEPGFSGDLRRAIHGAHVPLSTIAAAAQMEVFALNEFLEGTHPLTSTQIAAISDCLGLQLVRRILDPQPKRKP